MGATRNTRSHPPDARTRHSTQVWTCKHAPHTRSGGSSTHAAWPWRHGLWNRRWRRHGSARAAVWGTGGAWSGVASCDPGEEVVNAPEGGTPCAPGKHGRAHNRVVACPALFPAALSISTHGPSRGGARSLVFHIHPSVNSALLDAGAPTRQWRGQRAVRTVGRTNCWEGGGGRCR